MRWVQEWMNSPAVKRELGVDSSPVDFLHCNMTVNAAFYAQGQAMHNSAKLLPPLIKDGIRLLVFAGDTGACCSSDSATAKALIILAPPTDGVCNHMVRGYLA